MEIQKVTTSTLKEPPLVSVLMPVYNSCGTDRFSGRQLLPEALSLLQNQTYRNIEILILDNQSTDTTPEVCQEFAKRDARIRYIRDTEKRYVEGAITHLASFATGKYCFVANDDDRWSSTYVEKLVGFMEEHTNVDLCYPDCHFIDLNNRVISKSLDDPRYIYMGNDSPVYNFSKYILKRNVLPLAFGIFKTEVFQKTVPYVKFDTNNANVDNLLVSKFFLRGCNVHRFDEVLFYYRFRYRPLPKEIREDIEVKNEFYIWIHAIRHQLLFYQELRKLIEQTPGDEKIKVSVYMVALLSCIKFAIDSGDEIRYHTITEKKELKKYVQARRKYYGVFKRKINSHVESDNFYYNLKKIHAGDVQVLEKEIIFLFSVLEMFGSVMKSLKYIEGGLIDSNLYKKSNEIFNEEYRKFVEIVDAAGVRLSTETHAEQSVGILYTMKDVLLDKLKSSKVLYRIGIFMRASIIKIKLLFT